MRSLGGIFDERPMQQGPNKPFAPLERLPLMAKNRRVWPSEEMFHKEPQTSPQADFELFELLLPGWPLLAC